MDHQAFAQLLGNYGEFVGAIAVVVTLGYLAVQIKQSNLASELTALQTFFDSFSSVNVEPSRDVELIKVLRKGYATWNGMTSEEKVRLHLYWNDFLEKLHMGYRLRERGILDEASYCAHEDFLVAAVQTPGVGAVWSASSQGYPADFRNRIEERMADSATRPPPVGEWLPYWVADED